MAPPQPVCRMQRGEQVAAGGIMGNLRMKTSSWLLALPLAWLAASAQGAQAADPASGETLARRVCVNCHVVAPGEADKQVNAAIPSFKTLANTPGQTPEKIQDYLINPHPPMPQIQLTNIERANLAAYILLLKD
jgi:mono/diheme cytochrome c family protein